MLFPVCLRQINRSHNQKRSGECASDLMGMISVESVNGAVRLAPSPRVWYSWTISTQPQTQPDIRVMKERREEEEGEEGEGGRECLSAEMRAYIKLTHMNDWGRSGRWNWWNTVKCEARAGRHIGFYSHTKRYGDLILLLSLKVISFCKILIWSKKL